MMNGNCRKNFQQPSPCRFGMMEPNIFSPFTQGVGNWFPNTANIFFDPTRYAQSHRMRHFSTVTTQPNRFKPPQHPLPPVGNGNGLINFGPFAATATFIHFNPSMTCFPGQHSNSFNKNSVFNSQMDGVGHRLGHNTNKYNYKKPGCDENLDISKNNSNRNTNLKSQHINPTGKDFNKNRRHYYNKRNFRPPDKSKTSNIHDDAEYSTQNFRNKNQKSNKIHSLRMIDDKASNNKNNDNNNNRQKDTTTTTTFTLDDFPELPVPKQPWSIKFSPSCKSPSHHIAEKLLNKNKYKTSPKKQPPAIKDIPSSSNRDGDNVPKTESDKNDLIEDNFIIIMDSSSQPFLNTRNPNSTAGFTPFRPRQRQISECSDDSFIICFTNDVADGEIEFTDVMSSDDDSDDDDDDSSDDTTESDSDEDDIIAGKMNSRNRCKTHKLKNASNNKTENLKTVKKDKEESSLDNTSQPDSGFDDVRDKKVRFKLEPEVHVMHTWDYAYRAARKGDWENYARDRCRFQNRINKLEPQISAVLDGSHREKVFNERFSTESNDQKV